jgi:hypothetical protein
MAQAQKNSSHGPVPGYIMPDGSVPPYDEILHLLEEHNCSAIGSSYYYILANEQRTALCRIVPGAGKVFFHEIVEHEKYGVSEEDIEEAVALDGGNLSSPGYYPVSSHIDSKLRVLLDGE